MNSSQRRTNHQFDPFAPHPELDDVDVDMDGIDWATNADPFGIFSSRGMGPPPQLSPAKVREEARTRSKSVLGNFRHLRAIADRHEDKIQKRWAKKSRTQRLSILMETWPDMPATHRPDFSAFRRHEKRLPQMAAELRFAFILPHINQEDLAKPGTLPLLLNSRARNHPSSFAASDGDAMHLGLVTMALIPVFLNCYTMTLNGMTDDADYGRLVSWDDNDEAFDWMSKRTQFLPGEALLILEAQDRLMSFLVACCGKILHEIPPESFFDDAYPVQPEPTLKSTIDASGCKSLAVLAEEAPYRPPANIDLDSIESLISARVSSAEDHIWALREDPSYFTEKLFELKEHRQEMIKDTKGDVHPTLKPPREHVLWARISGSLVVEASFQLEMYSEILVQAGHLQDLKRKHEPRISPRKPLPEEYLRAILKLRHHLNQMAKGPMSRLKETFFPSPPMRSCFVRDVPVSASSSKIGVRSKPGFNLDKTTEHLMWLLKTLWEDGTNLMFARLPLVVDELDRLLKADPKASEMVSAYVARLISELSILAECLRQLEIYQPWANGFEMAWVDHEDVIKKDFEESVRSERGIMEAMRDENLFILKDFGDPVKMTSDYPVSKRRTKENVGKLRAAEANLDLFWVQIDRLLYAKTNNLRGTRLGQLLSQSRALQRTPEWAEPEPGTNKDKLKTAQPGGSAAEVLYMPFSSLSLGALDSNEKLAVEQKAKVKTRGAREAAKIPEEPQAPCPSKEDVQPTFKVDARALKVFRIVFFTPGTSTTAGEVAWNDFLHAMASTGFVAQKLYGSVWHFQPTRLDVERSIQFHEPHPKGKMPFHTAKHYGRRLSRAYGWYGGMFVPTD
ncbi:hypothetical protein F5X68DRAFT_171207 [Plectosphaerella plurivora]|uniref:Uncharacterized protein n=1 Tax=Plectosphaerella plurivora TaxID=936078 RepID=A0A9P8V9C1_9PEZI|nr:hypothetical protein F5X68DRAFT_171207 [Plectosphaerella plurivora]